VDDAASRFSAWEAAGWSERATRYERFSGRITARVADDVLDAAGVGPGTRVLDVGCGPGIVLGAALARGARPTGVDVSDGMLAEARRRHPSVALVQADATALPLPDAAFDAAVGGFVLNHLPAPERAVAEVARVLAPGGGVALSVWDRPERTRWLGVVAEALADEGVRPPPSVAEGPSSYRFADPAEMVALLEGAGLSDGRVRTIALVATAADADDLWSCVLGGSVRTSSTILAQPEEVQRRVRAAVERRVAPYRRRGRLELPVSVVIGAARR
jgi:SAM-dependent methyltransferase